MVNARTLVASAALALSSATAFAQPLPDAQAAPDVQPPSDAQPPSDDGEAKSAFEAGLTALRAERWPDAETKFRRSLSLVRRQSTLYDLAFVLFMEHRPRECLALLQELLREPGGDPQYQDYATQLMPRAVAELDTSSLPPAPAVTPSPAPEPAPRPVSVPPVPDAPRKPIAPWLVAGTGGALLVAGVVTGILALDADDALAKACPTNRGCDPSLRGTRDRAATLGHVTDGLLVAGGVLAAGGLTWGFLVPSPRAASAGRATFVTLRTSF